MQKRNEWYWKQDRLFVLLKSGEMKYYDMDMTQKGTIQLNKHCYCVNKDKGFELVT